ncbi:hypothetical protein [Streptomyces sp. BE133]|uniref:hypothetical protein n=1 Tax=Streptomyces sp. BE133 TaxID=3002523 RepID=UPI002E7654D0|nr:hypothetical protein [Streptomyces sp. BE133]MEE1806779.1 hypothetical protein [Streptomyces sp. BE133]
MEEAVLRLKEPLFPAIAGTAAPSVDVGMKNVRVDAQCTTGGGRRAAGDPCQRGAGRDHGEP